MTDAFALLGESRLPWIDPDGLKERFLRLSGPFHPDRVHSASESERQEANRRFAELSSAHHTLREHRDRLLHLLELESGAPPRDIQKNSTMPAATSSTSNTAPALPTDGPAVIATPAAATPTTTAIQNRICRWSSRPPLRGGGT